MDRSVGPPQGSGDAARHTKTVDATASTNAPALTLALAGPSRLVLELGCGAGSVRRALTEKVCRVLFGDVLEHVRERRQALRATRHRG